MMAVKDQAARPQKRRKGLRRFWLQLHLYLGLIAGFIFMIAGLTGSVLVFYVEIDEFLNPEIQISRQPNSIAQSYEQIFQSLRQKHPERISAWRLELPRNENSPLMARYYKPAETEHLHFAPLIAWVNPYTAEVLQSRIWGQFLVTWLYDLHYSLLLDTNGKNIMAIIGGLLLISLISGLYLWWPNKGQWRNAIIIKKNGSAERFNYDLHKVNGVHPWLISLLLVLTGVILEVPDIFKPLFNAISPVYSMPSPQSNPLAGSLRIKVDDALALAQKSFPQGELRWIETPKDARGCYRFYFYQPGEPSHRFPKSIVWVDQYSGQILDIHDPRRQSGSDLFLSWLHPLHNGEIFGIAGRWVVFFAGFIPLILYVTGFIRWQQKQRSKSIKAAIHPH